MEFARMLAYVTGTVDQELLLRNEYLAAENRILKAQLKGRLTLSDTERATLGEIVAHAPITAQGCAGRFRFRDGDSGESPAERAAPRAAVPVCREP